MLLLNKQCGVRSNETKDMPIKVVIVPLRKPVFYLYSDGQAWFFKPGLKRALIILLVSRN